MTAVASEESSGLPLDSDEDIAHGETLNATNGVAVKVTHCPVSQPLPEETKKQLDSSSSNTTPMPMPMDLFAVEGMGKGLSCVSLEVMTSGEHLNALSLEDLSDQGSGQGCGQDSGSEFTSSEGLDKMLSDSGGYPGEVLSEERCLDREDRTQDECPIVTVLEVPTQTTSEDSRTSSSMGCLEPRPLSQSSPDDNDEVSPSPKDIRKKLMEKMTYLTPEGVVTDHEEGVVPENKEGVATGGAVSTITSSHSSQSLNSGTSTKGISFGSIFKRRRSLAKSRDHYSETLAATSTTGLILHDRPKTLPAKSHAEEHKHQRLHQQMMAASRKKELQKAKDEVKREKLRRERDKVVADYLVEWERVLLKWERLYNTRKVRDLWWQGLPPGVRGKVWKKAIGNDLNISSDLFVINLRRCKERLALARDRSDSSTSQSSVSREQSVEVIHLDVLRTFPTLGFFQEGGPYNQSLRDVLGAYACYRPDIGYVQGMSFLAGVLLLNMDAGDSFIALANLLNRPSYLAFFKVDHTLMRPYFDTFVFLLQEHLPKLCVHFSRLNFSPEFYLIEWIFTIYTRVLPLDIACRVWDMFCRDGDSFLFRTALGILKLYQSSLLEFVSIEDMGQFLGRLPSNMESDVLFSHIDSIHFTAKRFKQILEQQQSRIV